MLRVYTIPVSLYCAKLRILLRRKQLEWEEIRPPGGYGSDEYKTHVPSGNLPALMDGDLLIADSEAIAEYLEECHPTPPTLPSNPLARARVRERGRFHDTRLEPAVRAMFSYLPGRASPPDGFITSQSAVVSARLAQLGHMLRDDDGAELTLGDCGLPVSFAWLDAMAPRMGLDIVWPEPVEAYRARLDALPDVAAELADYAPKLMAFLDEHEA
ncbi:MAG: glutathione S-transferase family protein [Pseudomonadota bacterium]